MVQYLTFSGDHISRSLISPEVITLHPIILINIIRLTLRRCREIQVHYFPILVLSYL